jgi:TPR repeat protein
MMHRRPFRRFPLVRARLLVAALLFALFALPFSGHRAEAAVPAAVLADLRSKAESGDSIAQYNLGVAYADAADPVSDASEAYAWLTLAGEQGANLEVLQTLIERLSPSQLAEGKRLYAKLAAHLKPSQAAKLAAELSGAPRKALYVGGDSD